MKEWKDYHEMEISTVYSRSDGLKKKKTYFFTIRTLGFTFIEISKDSFNSLVWNAKQAGFIEFKRKYNTVVYCNPKHTEKIEFLKNS